MNTHTRFPTIIARSEKPIIIMIIIIIITTITITTTEISTARQVR